MTQAGALWRRLSAFQRPNGYTPQTRTKRRGEALRCHSADRGEATHNEGAMMMAGIGDRVGRLERAVAALEARSRAEDEGLRAEVDTQEGAETVTVQYGVRRTDDCPPPVGNRVSRAEAECSQIAAAERQEEDARGSV